MKRAIKLGVWVSILTGSGLISALSVAADDTVRRDPAGVTGVSPFWEALRQGDNAFIAGDYDAAKTHYETAIKDKPQDPLGHTRVAQTLIAKGDLDAAAERLASALGFANKLETRAKVMFLQADIRERQAQLEQAKQRWTNYLTLVGGKAAEDSEAKNIHPKTGAARIEQIDAATKRREGYAAVKERIAKREKELEDKARGKR